MVHYRRDYTPGGTYFFTLALRNRQANYLTEHITSLGHAFRETKEKLHFTTYAITILPEHLHAIWILPDNDCDYSKRWRMIKGIFTKALLKKGVLLRHNARGDYHLWQRRFWEHRIKDEDDLQKHCDYIHYNPVKHGLVVQPIGWPYSSVHRFITQGIIPRDWGVGALQGEFGE